MKKQFWIGVFFLALFSAYFLAYFAVRWNHPEVVRQGVLRQIDDFNDLSSERKNRIGDLFFTLSLWNSRSSQKSVLDSLDARNGFDIFFAPCAKLDEMLTGDSLVFARQIRTRNFD